MNLDRKSKIETEPTDRDRIVYLYEQFLTLTKDSLECLENEDYSQLVELTNRRFKVFQAVANEADSLPAEVAEYLEKIIYYENRIIKLAKKKKAGIEHEFATLNNKSKIARAYCY